LKIGENLVSALHPTKGKFAGDKRVDQRQPAMRKLVECGIALGKVGDRYRGIRQDQTNRGRRRGGTQDVGSLPPMRASRRAASRSTRAFSASRTRADFP